MKNNNLMKKRIMGMGNRKERRVDNNRIKKRLRNRKK